MARSARAKGANMFVWILIGLLILGLAGFGIGSFTSSVSAIGSVGGEEITVDDYYQELQREINSYARLTGRRLTASQAVQSGLGQNALETLVLRAALDNEAVRVGVSVGDRTIMEELAAMPQFNGPDGRFNRDAYDFTLERTGMTAAEFDQTIRETQTRNLIQDTVSGGIPPAETYVDHLLNHYLSTREVTWAEVPAGMLDSDAPEPTDQDLRAYHAENEPEFTLPEIRDITVAWVTPEMLKDPESVAEARIRTLYNEREEQYSKPERRDVDRMVFPDRQAAETARERLGAEEIDFEELADELGIMIADISLGPVERSGLSAAAADVVFASESADIIGPVESSLGPALFRINAVLGAELTSFDEARTRLAEELARQDAESDIIDSITALEDLLAGGATVEELAAESDMALEKIAFDGNSSGGITDFAEFHSAALAAETGDFPELSELPGGGLFAMRIDKITPPAVQPFEDVRDAVADAWAQWQLSQRFEAKAEQLAAELKSGVDFEDLDLRPVTETGLTRNEFVDGAPGGLAAAAFSTGIRQTAAFGEGAVWGVLRVNSESPPDSGAEDTVQTVNALNSQYISGTGNDLIALYSDHLRREAKLKLELGVIDAIHAQLP